MYKEIKPGNCVSEFIQCYWISSGRYDSPCFQKIMPDGCTDIITNVYGSDSMVKETPYLIGTISKYIEVNFAGDVLMTGIRLKPGALRCFTSIPTNELTDDQAKLSDLSGSLKQAAGLIADIMCSDSEASFYSAEELITNLVQKAKPLDKLVQTTVEEIEKNCGIKTFDEIANNISLSRRQFERRFLEAVGVTPKRYFNIVRFNKALNSLKSGDVKNLLDAAIINGYYDHAHLIKEFKLLGGDTPSKLI